MYKNSKYTILFPLLLAVGVVLGLWFGRYMGRNSTERQIQSAIMQLEDNKLAYTLSLIEREYVDSLSLDSLAEQVIPLLVQQLDPHSVYIPRSEMQELNESLEGEFDGIGVVFNMSTDTVVVLNVVPSGPSEKAGVQAGDRIIRVDDSLIAGRKIPNNAVMKMLRGKRGSHVKLTLHRVGISDLVTADVVRDVIPIKSIEAAFMITKEIGYIKLSQFARTSHEELISSFARLRTGGMSKLIFDLRGNTGGYLDQAIAIANEFLHKGQLIVYTEDRYHQQVKEYADGTGTAQNMDVAVLIDEGSASSSEILAGALQDNDRGTIIGRRSFGKGLVQRQIPYSDGSALRLTTARYFTPTGRSIQKPYVVGQAANYEADMQHRFDNNEFFRADSIHFADSLRRVTPKGKVVYGGGGIMPDLFIPADTTDMSPYFIEVVGRNILYRFTMEYADKHRDELNRVTSIPALNHLLDSDRTLFDDFILYAKRQGVAPNYREIDRSHKLINAQLRAYIGRNTVLESNGFYANIYPVDRVMVRSIDVLEKNKLKND
ncbi:MAG: S41 family peptidase [Alistipes sp.]